MQRTRTKQESKKSEPLSAQVKKKIKKDKETKSKLKGSEWHGTDTPISTGSTLLDLAITGGRFEKGGIPTGIFVEIYGPPSAGKTALLAQIAANVQRMGGKIMFHDPEARLNKQFVSMFGLDTSQIEYTIPNTVTEVFESMRKWLPEENDGQLYGIFADSLAALSTEMEMGSEDKMGMRRAKEFSQELRKTCRVITQTGALVVCSNQIRQTGDVYGPKYKSPGGEAIPFYASLRLRCDRPEKLKMKREIRGKEQERIIGVKTTIEVYKSSVWKPYRTADVNILFDYGIDDIRGNLQYLKNILRNKTYMIGERNLGNSLEKAIRIVEKEGLEAELKEEVINLWNEVEAEFAQPRKPREW